MTHRAAGLFVLLFASLGACASTQDTSGRGGGAPLLARSEAPDPDALDDYAIPPGRCGTILWTLSGASPVPIFRSVDDGMASMVIEGQRTQLNLVGRGGEARLGIPSVQHFEGQTQSGAVRVTMRGQWGQPFPAGNYVEEAVLRVQGADGWSRVVPVAGIAGCRP
ncbi:hypothetical protein [Parvularcula oceani]|uniref:hypothetical protein n=1 Tax=Parvularcula oceani TaxID=1247963 RepID=UPI0004E24157|nr:hypothetical protein [Parvularcula oceani]